VRLVLTTLGSVTVPPPADDAETLRDLTYT
jgi:hypothetical protein